MMIMLPEPPRGQRGLATWRSELRSSFWRFGEGGCSGTMAPSPTSPMPSMCGNTFDNNNNDNNNNNNHNTNNNKNNNNDNNNNHHNNPNLVAESDDVTLWQVRNAWGGLLQPAAPSRPARQPGPTARLLPSKQARPQRLLQPRGSPSTASCCNRSGNDQCCNPSNHVIATLILRMVINMIITMTMRFVGHQ